MSDPLCIWDHRPQGPRAFLNLKDILAILPSRAAKSKWRVSPYVDDGEQLLDVLTIDRNVLEELAKTGTPMSFLKLTEAAETVDQVIWGVFSAYDGASGAEPWCTIAAVDSSYWVVDTQDHKVRRRVKAAFNDVRPS